MSTITDRVFVVTGGSKGFGLAIARGLVARGARIGLISRNQRGLDDAVELLGADNAMGVAADVADGESMRRALAAIMAHYGRLDGLVNNAGMARPSTIENLLESEVILQINTNFLGTVLGCQAAIPLLRGADNPRIVNISSASAWHGDEMSHLSIYAATKAAVERFSRDLRSELQTDGIGVTCVRPGAAWTSFSEGWDTERFKSALDAWHESGPGMDVGMESEQVADAVIFALTQPPGVAVDLLEIRPCGRVPKIKL